MPRGFTQKTPERVAEAQALRASGMGYVEIARRLGIAKSTAEAWINDPGLVRQGANRSRYARPCPECGTPMTGCSGLNGARRPKLCHACNERLQHEERYWTPETIVAALRLWTETHDGVPPFAANFSPALARQTGREDQGEEYAAARPGVWPPLTAITREFGSFNDAVRAAGFEPRPVGHYGREGEDMDVCREIARRYEAGETGGQLALAYGCSANTIYYRVRKAGGLLRPPASVRRAA